MQSLPTGSLDLPLNEHFEVKCTSSVCARHKLMKNSRDIDSSPLYVHIYSAYSELLIDSSAAIFTMHVPAHVYYV